MIVRITTLKTAPARLEDVTVVKDRKGRRWFRGTMHDFMVIKLPHRHKWMCWTTEFFNGPLG